MDTDHNFLFIFGCILTYNQAFSFVIWALLRCMTYVATFQNKESNNDTFSIENQIIILL